MRRIGGGLNWIAIPGSKADAAWRLGDYRRQDKMVSKGSKLAVRRQSSEICHTDVATDSAGKGGLLESAMTFSPPTAEQQIAFLHDPQRVFEVGDFSATYKFALLMSGPRSQWRRATIRVLR